MVLSVPLASGRLTNSDGDMLRVDLVQSNDDSVVEIAWPRLTTIKPEQLQETAARVMKVLSAAVVELAARRRKGW
jgi:hypothetical protein